MQRKGSDTFATILKVFTILLVVLFAGYLAGFYYNFYYTDTNIYKDNWNVILPGNLKKQYYISDFGFTGDGESFTIYKIQNGYTKEDVSFFEGASSQKNMEMQDEIIRILGSLKVEKQKYPSFSHDYHWKIISMKSDPRNKLYILYDTEASLVYFIQNFF